ncbi:hypothetical protein HGRIS_002131 [Hohenbuehelia grisea]|uniref:AB hydrolase-1 domain-containing protein n=1 Tax=Hohenbuehelia grisea TaxID=104357 RepID=A0ABR3JJR9_9AGAR
MAETTGFLDFSYQGESYKTWYKVVGDLKSTTATPLVLLHGGPGIPNPYLDPHTTLYASHRIPLVFYDQVGCGLSTHLPDKPASFWTIPLFVVELENVLASLGISGKFDLLGHSWGSILASEFITTRQPQGLRRLVLADPLASMALWEVGVNKLLKHFPEGLPGDAEET